MDDTTSSAIEPLKWQLNQQGKIVLTIKVIPASGKQEIAGLMADGSLKIKVKSAPEKNRANQELLKFLAKTFEISPEQIQLKSGHTSRKKLFLLIKNS